MYNTTRLKGSMTKKEIVNSNFKIKTAIFLRSITKVGLPLMTKMYLLKRACSNLRRKKLENS